MKQFSRMDDMRYDLSVRYSNNFYILNDPKLFDVKKGKTTDEFLDGVKFKGKAKIYRTLGSLGIVKNPAVENIKFSVDKIKEADFDIFHPTYYNKYFLKYIDDNKPFVLTVYDLIHEHYNKTHFKNSHAVLSRKKELIRKSSHIIAISENTKKDIIDIYNTDENKISIIYLGSSFNNAGKIETNNFSAPENYILYVGDRHLYKNFIYFLKSIKPLLLKEKNIFLVCAGSIDFTLKERTILNELGLIDKVFHFPLIDDSTLKVLYSKALCFAFPSLYEGFGIPVLEAFACGCPSVLSRTSSLPEVGGSAALYFDPECSESILETVKKVLFDKELAEKLRKEGFKQLENFSWEKCANETKKVYNKLV